MSEQNRKKILIVDDDQSILEALSLMLEEAGYIVEATIDGKVAQNMKDKLPDLLLLDIWLSGMDGRDICKYLKNQINTKIIPIILISANKDVQATIKDCGADDFIEKPFEKDYLLATIRKHLL